MTDPNSPSHWDQLASSLGAAPSPEQVDSRQPGPSPSAPPSPKAPARQKRPTDATRQTADWEKLAGDLGISPSPPPVPPENVAEPVVSVPPPLPESARPAPPVSERPEESPNFFDERFDFEEPFDLLDASEPLTSTSESAGQTAETEEKRSRKRRRRRRPRGRASDREQAPESDAMPSTDDSDQATVTSEEGSVDTEPRDEPAEAGESDERRSKRRRPRRGRKRRDGEAGHGAASEPSETTEKPHDADATETDAFAEDGVESDTGEQTARVGFRKIPTWEEAVGLLIDKNLEARSRQPAGGERQNRGNRGTRQKRGGKR